MRKAARDSSRPKRTKKAVTPSPSITSSTTETALPSITTQATESGPLTTQEQRELVEWLMKGASPAVACAQLGWPLERFWQALATDASFGVLLQQVFETLSQNILAALYQSAMKGNVTAMQFWLRHRPVSGWLGHARVDPSHDTYEQLNDDELVDACLQAGLDLPLEIATRLATSSRST